MEVQSPQTSHLNAFTTAALNSAGNHIERQVVCTAGRVNLKQARHRTSSNGRHVVGYVNRQLYPVDSPQTKKQFAACVVQNFRVPKY